MDFLIFNDIIQDLIAFFTCILSAFQPIFFSMANWYATLTKILIHFEEIDTLFCYYYFSKEMTSTMHGTPDNR